MFSLSDAGSSQIELHGIDSQHNIYFTLPQTHVVRAAKIHIYYAFSPSLLPQFSHIKLIMNGTLFATIQPTPGRMDGSDSRDDEAEFTIPPELLVHNNTLTMQFIGHYVHGVRRPGQHHALVARPSQHLSSTLTAICCLWPTI